MRSRVTRSWQLEVISSGAKIGGRSKRGRPLTGSDAILTIHGRRILVAEQDPYIADDICSAIEACGGAVAGPFSSVAAVLKFLSHQHVDGAVVDVALADGEMTPALDRLLEFETVVVLQTDRDISRLAVRFRHIPAFSKPSPTLRTLRRLVGSLDP